MNRLAFYSHRRFGIGALLIGALILSAARLAAQLPAQVTVTEVDEVIPTYLTEAPELNPMFFFGRQSQGAEGRIYPYPLYDNLTNRKSDVSYKLVYLENEYVKIGIAPEIGGRIFSGLDKTNGYDFIYRQSVIKPALIGLIGSWISGGVEWNIPHHHRASTFIPVQTEIEEHPDGGKTVWVGELELRHRMRWAVGYTLQPGSSVLECKIRILNRTPEPHSMLTFANVAVHVNDDYQIIFPPSTQFVTHHSRVAFTTWPIATTPYKEVVFDNVDVSYYKNHISANSMFAWNYRDDFMAGYDHGREAGIMSVANHHVAPGKKFWTWGKGERGQMWDKILTDDDGPYIELMVGGYSDNQPDYSWLQPYETRTFSMNFYPFQGIGGVKLANLDAAVNLEIEGGRARVGFATTRAYPAATMLLKAGERVLLEEKKAIDPGQPFVAEAIVPDGIDPHELRASIVVDGRELAAYSPIRLDKEPMPKPIEAPAPPSEIATTEELYLIGLHIDQFHSPTLRTELENPPLKAEPYWAEALRRDPADVRVNTAMGLLDLRRGRYASAESRFRKALERLTDRYTSPKDGEPFFYLGVALKMQGRADEAYNAFYKAVWSGAWKGQAYYGLAEIDSLRRDWANALDHVDRALDANALNPRAYGLKAAILRHMDRPQEALQTLAVAYAKTDPLDPRLKAEAWLLDRQSPQGRGVAAESLRWNALGQELAAEYMDAGLWEDGSAVLDEIVARASENRVSPMIHYYRAYFADKLGDRAQRDRSLALARQAPADYLFPFQGEAIAVLTHAISADPGDSRALYALGNLLFDWQPEEAMSLWERSVALDSNQPIALRNLAQGYARSDNAAGLEKAIALMERAIATPDPYPIHFSELDQLYSRAGADPEKRLAMLEDHLDVVNRRDDALGQLITLRILLGKTDAAIADLEKRTFNVWEGGSPFNAGIAWTDAHLARGRQRLAAGRPADALADFELALSFPDNLRFERSQGEADRGAEAAYWIGVARMATGDSAAARQAWTDVAASKISSEAGADSKEALLQRYCRAQALAKLGRDAEARPLFDALRQEGEAALRRIQAASDAPDSVEHRLEQRRIEANAHFAVGLARLGRNETQPAREAFRAALKADPEHLQARIELADLP
jgi:tetratricopeptide (TPR) repeat protein